MSQQNCIQSTTVLQLPIFSSCMNVLCDNPLELPALVAQTYVNPRICKNSWSDGSKNDPARMLCFLQQFINILRQILPSIFPVPICSLQRRPQFSAGQSNVLAINPCCSSHIINPLRSYLNRAAISVKDISLNAAWTRAGLTISCLSSNEIAYENWKETKFNFVLKSQLTFFSVGCSLGFCFRVVCCSIYCSP